MAESIVTSVPDPSTLSPLLSIQAHRTNSSASLIHLELRNQPFTIDREALMELPESILLCLFPNGVVLSQKQQHHQQNRHARQPGPDEEEHDVYYVDFDASCLSFILSFYTQARLTYYGTPNRPLEPVQIQSQIPSPLFYRQAIIVLREELEFFAIPTASDPPLADKQNGNTNLLSELKQKCRATLLEQQNIFTALQRNVKRENNVAEQHLIDMLCMSGFTREDSWGYRSAEPRRCAISSLALVLLKTGITHESQGQLAMTGPPNLARMNPQVNSAQLTTAQKLLLFWRKPARKCWWDATVINLTLSDQQPRAVKLWARRVWTLELSLI
ncbi:hypothetical protein PTTG_02493 [Puccinia triticina 1-1 BBBD Race 1]|uniref:Phosphatase activator n=2 Tax=Puccinia triticina TaxID=208348 RepID=A0A180GJQ7_PUCT1|nr:uncharacterized protein PtA15_4A882 [Puccinia triticina]OAV92689.1 hypothetical protein PTTG_02493 [Puccinia triticina 1-1 BBBD Race 1]WAQ84429.1 hypothetical protein PtA15_4A882 [Puccinia triticina]WAR55261.1 hypothetical protein PtB15_4B881 [Puccinia triticina]